MLTGPSKFQLVRPKPGGRLRDPLSCLLDADYVTYCLPEGAIKRCKYSLTSTNSRETT